VTPAIRGARAAVVFLTRVPIGGFPYSSAEWRWASGWLPLVGAGIGGLMSGLWLLVEPLGPAVAATLVLTLSIVITGGLHEDGLADTADALGGATSRDRVFEILKDSRIGSFGGLALILSVLLRVSLLVKLSGTAVPALILSQCIARVPPVWLMVTLPYVSPDHTAKSRVVAGASWLQGALAALLAVLVMASLSLAGLVRMGDAAVAAGAALLGTAICGYLFRRRAGGITGDFLGASEQVGECLVLLALAVIQHGLYR
jgi:adenosylcobinamide-GDP ribazoletransferase